MFTDSADHHQPPRALPRKNAQRPSQPRPEKRHHPKLIRFSASELERVAERARYSGRPVACFIRESSLRAAPRARRTELSDEIIRALTRVAERLVRLGALATAAQLDSAPEFEQATADVLSLIRQLD